MKITIIGAKGKYNAEYFFIKAFKELSHKVNFIDRYGRCKEKGLNKIVSV
jgi:hypothetical protein